MDWELCVGAGEQQEGVVGEGAGRVTEREGVLVDCCCEWGGGF